MAFIMDGNRRWAKKRLLPAIAGHKAGKDTLEKTLEICVEKGIEFATFWALSTENFKKRSEEEIGGIIKLLNNIEDSLGKLLENDVRLDYIGDLSIFPEETREILAKVKEKTKNNSKTTCILALNYGGRDEIVRGIKKFIQDGGDLENLDEKGFENYIDSGKFPPADVIVRTGGDVRTSGFLLYMSPYSEFYFTETKWPDFNREEFEKVVEFLSSSKRNFGK